MSANKGTVVANALNMSFVDRVNERVTNSQFNRLTRNLAEEGVLERLAAVTGRQVDLGDKPRPRDVVRVLGGVAWDMFMQFTDDITSAKPVPQPGGSPKSTLLSVGFATPMAREGFHYLADLLYGGIHRPTMLHIRTNGERGLTMHNFTHPDAALLGRVGTALFRLQYGEQLGPNLRLVLQRTVSQIYASGVYDALPSQLKTRIHEHSKRLSGDTLLTSGQISLIGAAARLALANTGPLDMQRPRRNRPAVEAGTRFFARRTRIVQPGEPERPMPVSGATIQQALAGQALDAVDALKDPYARRDVVDIAAGMWDILVGLGIKEGLVSATKAIGTVGVASVAALWGMNKDRRLRNKLEAKNKPPRSSGGTTAIAFGIISP